MIKNIPPHIIFPLFLLLVIGYFASAYLTPVHPIGESDDYMLALLAILSHFSDEIRPDDIAKAFVVFPEHAPIWNAWLQGLQGIKLNGLSYTWYFPTYSIAVTPFYYLSKALGFSQSYAFPLANATYWLIALIYCYQLKWDNKFKIPLILTLGLGPIMFYTAWPSAEMFLCSLVLISLVSLEQKKYLVSILTCSLAGTLNITIAPLSVYIYILALYDNDLKTLSPTNFFQQLRSKKILILKLLAINSIIFIPIILNFIRWGKPTAMAGMADFNNISGRFLAYLFDLNFGFFPYYPLVLLTGILVACLCSKRIEFLSLILSLSVTMFGFSLMSHINCGITGIHRYVSWSGVPLVFGTFKYVQFINKTSLRRAMLLLLVMGMIYTILVTKNIGGFFATYNPRASYVHMTPVARYILDRFPSLYNPLYSTFNSRISHQDGGYTLPNHPLVYFDKKSNIRKILLKPSMLQSFAANLDGAIPNHCIHKPSDDSWFYIDIPKNIDIHYLPNK